MTQMTTLIPMDIVMMIRTLATDCSKREDDERIERDLCIKRGKSHKHLSLISAVGKRIVGHGQRNGYGDWNTVKYYTEQEQGLWTMIMLTTKHRMTEMGAGFIRMRDYNDISRLRTGYVPDDE